jgi:replicative DNA helicase
MSVPKVPHSREAERAVLGGLMQDPEKLGRVDEVLTPDDFYAEIHQRLFRLMGDQFRRGEPLEMVALVEYIVRTEQEEQFGGISYVTELADDVPSTMNIEYYARVVHERALERRLLAAAAAIVDEVNAGQRELPDLLNFSEKAVFDVTQQRRGGDWRGIADVVHTEFARIQELSKKDGDITGISTGFIDLDGMLAGLHRTDLIVLAARPAMGKTAFVLNIARNVAKLPERWGVGVFSLEMSAEQLTTRMLVSEARVRADAVRTGRLSADDWLRFESAARLVTELPIYIDDTPGVTISQVRSKARRLKSLVPSLSVLIVDYIGLMQGDPGVSRQEQVAASSRGLKGLAKELGITVIALSQLNRAVEQRPNKVPVLSDLRESGAIEQDADIILFIYRDEYYNKDSEKKGVAEIVIAKHRNGATGSVELSFQGEFTLFDNLEKRHGGFSSERYG